jgi:O-antigen/teichoic acid export membrane protein
LAFAAWLGLDLTNTAVLFAAAVILVNILLFIDLRRLYPEMFPWWQGGDFRHGMGNFARSSLVTGIGLLDYFSLQGVVLLVAGGLGAVFVPLFTTLRTLANTAMQGVGFLLNPIQPDIVRYHVHREPAKLVSVFAFFWFACGLTLNVVLMAGLFLVENIYAAWTQGRLDFDRPLFAWLAASVLARVLGSPFLAYLTSINDLRAQATVALVRAVLVVAGTTLLMPHWRLAGVGAALCLAEIAGTLLSAGWFTSRALKRIGGKIETVSLFWAAAATGASGAALWAFAMDLTTWPWVVALASVVIAVTANIQWRLLSADLRVRVLTLLPIVSVRSMAAMRARSSANHT